MSSQSHLTIVFMAGLLLKKQRDAIEQNSTGIVQYAADSLQRGLIAGISSLLPMAHVSVVNLPFIGSYPQSYKKAWFSGTHDFIPEGVNVTGIGFFNLRAARIISRFVSSLWGLCRRHRAADMIVIYSPDNQFLAAASLYAAFTGSRLCLILPDLPEFIGANSLWRRTTLLWQTRIFRFLITRVHSFVLLTDAMAERLKIPKTRYVTVEGIYDDSRDTPDLPWSTGPERVFSYTGSIMKQYGILDLIEAFRKLPQTNARLIICGEGDARHQVEKAAQMDSRIQYLGQVSPEVAVNVQGRSHILVNPRSPYGEYTRYSFPSKTIEYMASGRPVLMNDLPGLPPEYRPHIVMPPSPDVAGLHEAMKSLLSAESQQLQALGAEARKFVLASKTPRAQCSRIVDLLTRDTGCEMKES